jgi:hypothetical protein
MKTDDLIEALSRSEEPVKPRSPLAALAGLAGLGLIGGGLLLYLVFGGARPDFASAMPIVLMKAGFSALFATIAALLVARLARPGASPKTRVTLLVTLFAAAGAISATALFMAPPGARMAAWTGGGFPWCIAIIPFLAVPAAFLILRGVKAFAPTRLATMGAAIGAAAGGVGAMAYSTYCPVDQLAFVTTWYAVGIGLCAAMGALLGRWLLRW